ncbi:hypothetical protein JHK85_000612 [Glycine max]|nr:hypothetical protein JHK85_000612 [Glycine max]KAG5087984.1 hypothetical protein JHK86_000596 [Glycine max]
MGLGRGIFAIAIQLTEESSGASGGGGGGGGGIAAASFLEFFFVFNLDFDFNWLSSQHFVGASLFRFIKGKGGSTQKKIEEDIGVKIIIATSKEEDFVNLGIDKSIFIKPKTFHLTILMLKLWNKERIKTASEVLQMNSYWSLSVYKIYNDILKGCMKGSLAKARVLYAPVEETSRKGATRSTRSPISVLQDIEKVDKAIDGRNVYNILEPCYHFPDAATAKENGTLPKSFKQLGVIERHLLVRKRMFGRAWPFRAPVKPGLFTLWPQLAQTSMSHVLSWKGSFHSHGNLVHQLSADGTAYHKACFKCSHCKGTLKIWALQDDIVFFIGGKTNRAKMEFKGDHIRVWLQEGH